VLSVSCFVLAPTYFSKHPVLVGIFSLFRRTLRPRCNVACCCTDRDIRGCHECSLRHVARTKLFVEGHRRRANVVIHSTTGAMRPPLHDARRTVKASNEVRFALHCCICIWREKVHSVPVFACYVLRFTRRSNLRRPIVIRHTATIEQLTAGIDRSICTQTTFRRRGLARARCLTTSEDRRRVHLCR